MNRCVHTDRPFMLSKTRDKIFCRVWHITMKRKELCVFLILTYHLLGVTQSLQGEKVKDAGRRQERVLSAVLLVSRVLYVLLNV